MLILKKICYPNFLNKLHKDIDPVFRLVREGRHYIEVEKR